jgi:CheY-like chemotaxis protein/HPt (histidine-containing phosphotransfer) domain-containing protein
VQNSAIKAKDSHSPDSLANYSVLLAEDTPDIQGLVAMLLANAGADVRAVDDGQRAVETAWTSQREGKPFDIILMDMQMPVMDGFQATRRLRLEGYDGRIVAMTAHSMQGDCEKCLAAGCDDYISKPIDPDRLIEVVAKSLNTNRIDKTPINADLVVEPTSGKEDVLYSQYADRPVIAGILSEFISRLDGRIRAMEAALLDSQADELQHLAHQLKGTAGSYGYPALSTAAKALEDHVQLGCLESAAMDIEHIAALSRAVAKGWKGLPDPANLNASHTGQNENLVNNNILALAKKGD